MGVADDVCNSIAKISVDIPRPETTNSDGDPVELQPHSGAILNTVFTVSATAVKDSNDECATVTEETGVNDNDTDETDFDDTVGVTLTVVQQPLSDGDVASECDYDVAADVPPGFDVLRKNSNTAQGEGLRPDSGHEGRRRQR